MEVKATPIPPSLTVLTCPSWTNLCGQQQEFSIKEREPYHSNLHRASAKIPPLTPHLALIWRLRVSAKIRGNHLNVLQPLLLLSCRACFESLTPNQNYLLALGDNFLERAENTGSFSEKAISSFLLKKKKSVQILILYLHRIRNQNFKKLECPFVFHQDPSPQSCFFCPWPQGFSLELAEFLHALWRNLERFCSHIIILPFLF